MGTEKFGGRSKESEETEGSDGSAGNKGGSGGRRSTIIVKGNYGTKTISPDTDCEKCDDRAVGVLIVKKSASVGTTALCSDHRDRLKNEYPETWKHVEFRRFVDA